MMSIAAIDACCLIDLLTSGHVEAILQATGIEWHLPSAVESEVQHIRQFDPSKPGHFIKIAADLSFLKSSGILKVCMPTDQLEQDRFVYYAAQFRSDGEAMCIALAERRGWQIATDDRKAIRVAQHAGINVLSCPELIRRWVEVTKPDTATITKALCNIQQLAQFKPNPAMPEFQWWPDKLTIRDT